MRTTRPLCDAIFRFQYNDAVATILCNQMRTWQQIEEENGVGGYHNAASTARRPRNETTTTQKAECYQKHCWVRPIFQRRRHLGKFHTLVQEMRVDDPTSHFSYFRMSKGTFDMLLGKVSFVTCICLCPFCNVVVLPLQHSRGYCTNRFQVSHHLASRSYFSSVRAEITAAERLALTLRFLASGNSQVQEN